MAGSGPVIDLLRAQGASEAEIATFISGDTMQAGEVILRIERPEVTLEQAAAQSGFDLDVLTRLWRALGFPPPQAGEPIAGRGELEKVLGLLSLVWQLLGPEPTIELARVLGASTARIAEALVSTFHTRIGEPALASDPTGFAFLQATVATRSLLDSLDGAIALLLRRQLISHMRPLVVTGPDPREHETLELAVGFVDLVGYTEMAQGKAIEELHGLISGFEHLTNELVSARGGRIVKTIGDEVMFTFADPVAACLGTVELVGALGAGGLPGARGGVDYGEVLIHGGDYFGSSVNVASRLTRMAEPGSALTTTAMRDKVRQALGRTPSGIAFSEAVFRSIRGIEEDVGVVQLFPQPVPST